MTDAILSPVLPLRDIVVFPHMVVPLFVGREKSIAALEEVMRDEKRIVLLTQKDSSNDDPGPEDIYGRGCIAKIMQLLKLPDGTVRVLVEGEERIVVDAFTDRNDIIEAHVAIVADELPPTTEGKALVSSVVEGFNGFSKLNKKIAEEISASVAETKDPSKLADLIAVHLNAPQEEKQKLLAESKVSARLEKILRLIEGEMSVLSVEKKIRGRVKRQMEKTQREYYLNEQMKAIKKELHEGQDGDIDELDELAAQVKDTKLSKEARKKADKELKKLKQMPPMSAESTVSRNYLDWIVSVPWGKKSRVHKDIRKAKAILDQDHYGLDKVKERILEYLAVQQRTNKVKVPVLCQHV